VLIASFISLFLGVKGEGGRSAVNETIRMRVIKVLSRSVAASNSVPGIIQVLFESIFSPSSSSKLRLSGLQV
jgi:hypothetical protein